MSDHQDYCDTFINNISTQNIENLSDSSENIFIEERSGDDFLIELFRERSFLYDKSNPNFKDILMKENAWKEISKAMIETNCGDFYTPDYCQKRCASLRDQYSREKRKIESQSKSGSAASTSLRLPFFSQLTFLDKVIKRRRTYSNVTKSQSNASSSKKIETSESDDVSIYSPSNKENQHTNCEQPVDGMFIKRSPKLKRRKMDESKQLEQTFLNVSNKIMNYMEDCKLSIADNAFMEFIKIQFSSVPEHEKNIRMKLIIDAISAPLP